MSDQDGVLRRNETPLRAPADFNERLFQRIAEERQLARERRDAVLSAAAVVLLVACAALMAWRRFAPAPAPTAVAHSPKSLPAAAPRSESTAAPVGSAPPQPHVARQQQPAKKNTAAPPPVVVQTDTTGTFPAPPPRAVPYRSNIEWAVETIGPDGQPVNPPSPTTTYYRKGLPRTTTTPPGTPRMQDHLTVTAPPATTTTTTATDPPPDVPPEEP